MARITPNIIPRISPIATRESEVKTYFIKPSVRRRVRSASAVSLTRGIKYELLVLIAMISHSAMQNNAPRTIFNNLKSLFFIIEAVIG